MKNTGERLNQTFLVKTAFLGLLVLLLFMGATPAKAHQVIEGTIPASNAEYLIGVKYRSFGNSPDPQALIGLMPLGGVNQVAGNIAWSKEQKNFFKFTYDPVQGKISTVIFRMDPSYKSSIFTYTIPPATLNLDLLSMMKVSIVCGGTGAKVALKNVIITPEGIALY